MAIRTKHILASAVAMGALWAPLTYAQATEAPTQISAPSTNDDLSAVSKAVLSFLEEKPSVAPALRPDLERYEAVIQLAEQVSTSYYNRDAEALREAIDASRHPSIHQSDQLVRTQGVAEKYIELYKVDAKPSDYAALIDGLPEGEWFLTSMISNTVSHLYMTENEFLNSARMIETALDIIPNTYSSLGTYARHTASAASVNLHGIQGNTLAMLEAARLERDTLASIGQSQDRYVLISNFIYTLNKQNDFEGAAKVGEYLLELEQPESFPTGVAESYLARSHLELGNFDQAVSLVTTPSFDAPHPVAAKAQTVVLAVAYAGQGRIAESQRKLDEIEARYGDSQSLNQGHKSFVLYAESLLAQARGEHELALELMKRRGSLAIARQQSINAADINTMLATLQNTRERQVERATALRREAALKATQLEQQKNLNRMLLLLLSMAGLGLIALIFFLRFRERLNVKVQDLQKQALSAEKMKTEFLGLVNHELRTPLNAVIGISDALIHHNTDAAVVAQAQAIQDSGEQLFDLLESLIDMSTIEAGKLELGPDEVDIADILRTEAARWDRWANQKSLDFTRFIAPELSGVSLADGDRIRQITKFLLSNAVRFTHQGRVHMHATVAPKQGRSQLTLIVADTGQGISEAVQSRLFKPFVQADATMTRKYGGAGLSLSIARKLARMMDGDVVVQSTEGRGSEFRFTAMIDAPQSAAEPLPETVSSQESPTEPNTQAEPVSLPGSSPQPAPQSAPALQVENVVDVFLDTPSPSTSPEELQGLRVLIVEDLPSNQDVIRLLLEPEGIECIAALSGPQALDVLHMRRVDAVVMDIRMPGMDGFETTRRIRDLTGGAAANANVPVIMLSADAPQLSEHKNAGLREAGYLTKPVSRSDLLSALRRARRQVHTQHAQPQPVDAFAAA